MFKRIKDNTGTFCTLINKMLRLDVGLILLLYIYIDENEETPTKPHSIGLKGSLSSPLLKYT